MSSIVVLLFVLLLCGTVKHLLLVHRLFSRLSKSHPDVWRQLGEPALVSNSTPRNNMLFLGWLWRKDYQRLSRAPQDVILAARVRALLVALILSFAALVVVLLRVTF